jgi:predicted GNAT superfamily acetyltransferase
MGGCETRRVTSTPSLRPIAEADVPAVLALNHRFVDLLSPLDAERLLWLVGLADHADVVEVEERVAGFVLTMAPGAAYDSENYRWHADRYGDAFYYLDRIVIAEDQRRRGLAGFVYDAMEDAARRFGRMTLEVNVDPPNAGSLAFHQRRGYVEVGRLGEPGHLVGLMAKELTTKA